MRTATWALTDATSHGIAALKQCYSLKSLPRCPVCSLGTRVTPRLACQALVPGSQTPVSQDRDQDQVSHHPAGWSRDHKPIPSLCRLFSSQLETISSFSDFNPQSVPEDSLGHCYTAGTKHPGWPRSPMMVPASSAWPQTAAGWARASAASLPGDPELGANSAHL